MQWEAPQVLQVELGPSFFIPNNQIGSFGAITQFKCLLRNNRDMFDISGAGVFSAAAVSIALFAVGLAWSTGADVPKVSLSRQRQGSAPTVPPSVSSMWELAAACSIWHRGPTARGLCLDLRLCALLSSAACQSHLRFLALRMCCLRPLLGICSVSSIIRQRPAARRLAQGSQHPLLN